MHINRRRFIQGASVAAAAVSAPWVVARRALAANDEIRAGVVGLGIRGLGSHIRNLSKLPGVALVAVCDPDASRLNAAVKHCKEQLNRDVDGYADMRRLIERKDIDVVCHATQQYWHALGAIWSCQAGKHVYVEKPSGHYIWESRQMVNAARKYNRIMQCGTQQRSVSATREAVAWLKAGNLGKIKLATAYANKPRPSVGKRKEPLPIPPEVDYELWCGPARKLPIYRDKLQYDCSFDWNTGDGESVNQGVHEIDMARWVLGINEWPRRVLSIGGRFVVNDAADCPNTQICYYDYPDVPLLYEVHNLRAAKGSNEVPTFRGIESGRTAAAFDCEGGLAIITFGGKILDHQGKLVKKFEGGHEIEHFANFIEAVKANDPKLLHAEIAEGHLSTSICHAGNISLRLGRKAPAAEIRQTTRDIPAFNELFEGMVKHLKAHELDVDSPTITLGQWLEPVAGEERFKDNPAANELVRGFSREPFTVPAVA
jgi:predicted dehydrogenase